jgi:hypothetical protein
MNNANGCGNCQFSLVVGYGRVRADSVLAIYMLSAFCRKMQIAWFCAPKPGLSSRAQARYKHAGPPSDGNYGCGERLRRIGDRAVAQLGTDLRRERLHAKRPEGPALSRQRPPLPAGALSAQVKLANPVNSVRRTDRGPAPIARLIHLPAPASPAVRPRCPARCAILIAHHVKPPWPARPLLRRAPQPGIISCRQHARQAGWLSVTRSTPALSAPGHLMTQRRLACCPAAFAQAGIRG